MTQGGATNLAAYAQSEFELRLKQLLKQLTKNSHLDTRFGKKAYLLGGQSGAGKTNLHKLIASELEKNVIIINGDEYRSLHPRFVELNAKYGADSVSHTAEWAGKMTEALINSLSVMGYNLIIEGTLRTSQVPLRTAKLLRDRGYAVSLALMAVKPEISLISCQIRYQLMRIAGTTPRATDPAHHNKIVEDIVGNLGVLEESGLFDSIRLFTRGSAQLFPLEGETRGASEVLCGVLFGPWSAEEKQHYEFLQMQLSRLK